MNKVNVNKSDLLDTLTGSIVVLDAGLHVVYMNQAAEMLFGQSQQRAVGIPVALLLRSHEVLEHLGLALSLSDPQSIRECVIEVAHGEQITIDCVISPLALSDWQNHLLLEVHRVDRKLRIVREEQVIHQQQAVHELVRGIAHEIKNPLGGLRGAAQLLESELDDPELKEYTQIIISEADRLKHLVDGMLGPSRLPLTESVNIHEVLEHVRHLVSAEVPASVRFVRDYDPSLPEFQGDRNQLVQVVLNIVNNATRALDGAGLVELRTRVLRQCTIQQIRYRHVLKVEICDNGPGVPEHLQDKLFLPMVSGHPEGSGLGLAIAQRLVRRHHGLIHCESAAGRTCFSILIPLENDHVAH
ncbi:nitrogen regulation protein NR(II) [Thiothrix lacustris]|uniref:nitrogen regulation protein NR(II) n=1 Tax=Thiothrix lacustris TaxID=525917 RepID=UPI0027E53AC3|nr:nitrogen regulation protein NR(II) [Thiothrix lacustris]WMP16328.1 nitrogen regulation protein NR(II) [Thiothrix lacustris]